MVKIRLTRGGSKKRPYYRVTAIDERKRRDGRPLEFLGTYDPKRPVIIPTRDTRCVRPAGRPCARAIERIRHEHRHYRQGSDPRGRGRRGRG